MIKVLETGNDARELLEERAKADTKLRAVIILELHQDGSQRLLTSNCSQYEKCFLKTFFDSQVMQWFENSYVVTPEP